MIRALIGAMLLLTWGGVSAQTAAPPQVVGPLVGPWPTPTPAGLRLYGSFYAPNIIDAYTEPDGAGGRDIFWNVSTWNPYGVVLMRSNLTAASGTAGACGAAGKHGRLRWCAAEAS